MDPKFDLPEGATEEQARIHATIVKVIGPKARSGGCRGFYTPQQWRQRGEEFGLDSALIVVHDGGDLAPYFNYAYERERLREKMNKALKAIGYYADPCTGWYTAIVKANG